MDIQTIEIKVDEKGEITYHVQGITGMECKEKTAALEALLGGDLTFEYTPEAFGGDSISNTNQVSA